MVHDFSPSLPEIFSTNGIEVDSEAHRYQTFEGGSGSVLEEREYTLDKAPIDEILEVTGILDGSSHTFVEGTDFELSSDSERIIWKNDPADRPDAGSIFNVTYKSESIISRYIESSEEEFESIDDQLQKVIEAKFVDKASGEELDRLGALFGELGKRNGRSDLQYRGYLKSVVQSFVSRGTKNGIKLAISATTEVAIEDITIDEDFDKNEYDIIVVPNTPITGTTIEEVAEIADPSGVELGFTRYRPFAEDLGVRDEISFSLSPTIIEEVSTDDAVVVDGNKFTSSDEVSIDDVTAVDPNKTSTSDEMSIDDATASNRGAASEAVSIDDGNANRTRDVNSARWEEQSFSHEVQWNFAEWTVSIVDETVSASDTMGSNDTVASQQQLVAWDSADWNETDLIWTKEHN